MAWLLVKVVTMDGLMDGLLPHQLHGGGSSGRDHLRVWCPVAQALEFASLRRSYWPDPDLWFRALLLQTQRH